MVSLDFLDPDFENSNKTLSESEKSAEILGECLILFLFSFHENPK